MSLLVPDRQGLALRVLNEATLAATSFSTASFVCARPGLLREAGYTSTRNSADRQTQADLFRY